MRRIVVLTTAALTLTLAASAFACGDKATSMAWSGAWLQRSAAGTVTVAEVAKASPAARAGLRAGDVVTAVNGRDVSSCAAHASMCAAKASSCTAGSTVTYQVRRGHASKIVRVTLAPMPEDASQRYAHREASFDPTFAALIMPAVD